MPRCDALIACVGMCVDGKVEPIETYVGFHVGEGFWVNAPLDLQDPVQAGRLRGIVPEIAISSITDRFKVIVCLDGLTLLRMQHLADSIPDIANPAQFDDSVLWWREHLDYANALQTCLESASIQCSESSDIELEALSLTDTCRVGFRGMMPIRAVAERGRSLMDMRRETTEWIAGGMSQTPPAEVRNPEWKPWRSMSPQTIRHALRTFEAASASPDRVKWLSFIAQAKTAFVRGNYIVAFVLLWFVIESVLNAWEAEHLSASGNSHVSSARMIQQLAAAGYIDSEMQSELGVLRKLRNQLMHQPSSTPCLPYECARAAQTALRLSLGHTDLNLMLKWQASTQF